MDAAQSKGVPRPIRIICIALLSLVFLIAITGLFLLVFVIEGQSLFRRGIFLIMGLIALVYFLRFLNTVVRKGGKSRDAAGR